MAVEPRGHTHFPLPPVLLDPKAVAKVDRLLEIPDGGLEIHADRVRRIDAFGAVVIHAALERFVQRHPDNVAVIYPPLDASAWSWFSSLISDLPNRCSIAGDVPHPPAVREVLLPCRRVRDQEDHLVTKHDLKNAVRTHARLRRVRLRRLLIEAMSELIHNGLTHGSDSDVDVVCGACLEPQSNQLQVVVFDGGQQCSSAPDTALALREAYEKSTNSAGGMRGLLFRDGTPARLRLAAGTARFSLQHRESTWLVDSHLSGFLASLEIPLFADIASVR